MKKEWMKMWRKEISMASKTILFLGFIVLLSCGCADKKTNQAKRTTIYFEATHMKPHCGGAQPDPSEVYPKPEPAGNMQYTIFMSDDQGQKSKIMGEITTDEEGKANFDLPDGQFSLWRTDKLLKLEEFVAINKLKDNQYMKYKGNECFEKWKQTPDAVFTTDQNTVKLILNNRCFTGTNPCAQYTGPLPP